MSGGPFTPGRYHLPGNPTGPVSPVRNEWSRFPRTNDWTVLAVVSPGHVGLWLSRPDHALLLGIPIREEEVRALRKTQRTLVFLGRGPGVVRVINAVRDHKILGREMAHDRVVALAETDPHGGYTLPLPMAVVSRLGLRTDGAKNPKLNDSIAWVVPTAEYAVWREAREAPPPKPPRASTAVLSALRGRRRQEPEKTPLRRLPPVSVYLAKIQLPATPAVG